MAPSPHVRRPALADHSPAEAAQRASAEQLQLALDAANAGTWSWDVVSNVSHWDERYQTLYGIEPQEPPSFAAWIERVHSLDRAKIMSRIQVLLQPGSDNEWREEFRTLHPVKGERWMEGLGRVYRSPDGQALYFTGINIDITERKQAEAERQKFVSLADSSGEFVGLCDRDFTPFYINPAGLRMVGLENLQAACRTKVRDYFYPEDQAFITEEFFPRVMREGHGEVEIRFRHFQTGAAIWMLYYVFNIQDEHGAVVGWATVSRNIHDRKKTEEKLRESDERLRAFLENSAIIGWMKDAAGKYVFLSENFQRNFGARLEEWQGKTDFDLWPQENAEVFRRNDLAVLHGGRALEVLEEATSPDGVVTSWLSHKFPFQDASGNRYVGGLAVDMTARLAVEAALRESEERLRLATEAAGIGTYITNLQTRRVHISPELADMVGLSRDGELTEEDAFRNVHPEDLPRLLTLYQAALDPTGPGRLVLEVRVVRPSGEVRWLSLRGQVEFRRTSQGQVPWRHVGAVIDVTDRQLTEEALQRLNTTLEMQVVERTAALAQSEQLLAADLAAMTRLQKVGALFVRKDGMPAVLEEILAAAIAITDADMGNLQVVDKKTGGLRIEEQRGFQQHYLNFWNQAAGGQGACGLVKTSGERVLVEDITQSPIFLGSPTLEVQLAAGVRAVQSTPLLTRAGKLLGVISTHYRAPRQPEERALRMLDLLARQAADILERADAEETLQQRLVELTILNRVGVICSEAQTEDELLSRTTALIAESLQLDNCGFLLLDSEREILTPHSSFVITDPKVVRADIALEVGITGQVARTGQAVRLGDVRQAPNYLPTDARTLSELCVPIKVGAKVVGVVNVESAHAHAFSATDEQLMTTMVDLVGNTLERLRATAARKELEREVVAIASLEQQRIGQDLHDNCGQELTALGLLADILVESLEKAAPQDVDIARKMRLGLRRVLRQVRNISRGLAQPEVHPAELPAALVELTARLAETSGVSCDFQGESPDGGLSCVQATHLYHIAQEACTNALKHAQARHITVRLRAMEDAILLEIRDDGRGISPQAREGLGRRIMRNRASVIGADLTISSVEPHGTMVACKIPRNPT